MRKTIQHVNIRMIYQCLLSTILVTMLTATFAGGIYRYQNSDGSVVFTDQPQHNATRVELGITQTIKAVPIAKKKPAQASPDKKPAEQENQYSELMIVNPSDDQAIRNNAGGLVVRINSHPALDSKRGDRLILMLDDAPLGPPLTRMEQSFTNIDRGSHTLQAIIIDKNDVLMQRSEKITFHMLRHAIQHKTP